MKKSLKLSLDVDALRVDSFATQADADGERGTVQGHAKPQPIPFTTTGDGYCPCWYETNADLDCTYGCQTRNVIDCGITLEPLTETC